MDIIALAQELSTFLTPFLPYLLKIGEKASEEAGKKLGAVGQGESAVGQITTEDGRETCRTGRHAESGSSPSRCAS